MSGRAPRALFAPACGPEVGGGHLLRDLALAQALAGRGARCRFALPPWGEARLARFAEAPFEVHRLGSGGERPALAAALDAWRPDMLVLDDYGLGSREVASLRRPGLAVAVVHDLADRAYDCDLLVDPGHGRTAAHYRGLVPAACRVLVGPDYALLRRAFSPEAAGPPHPIADGVGRVLVSFGLSDVGGVTGRAVRRLLPLARQARFDVALGSDAASLPLLRELARDEPRLRLHPDAADMAALMRGADAAVGAGGSSVWERAALGLPSLVAAVADNQRALVQALADRGAVLAAELEAAHPETSLEAGFARLLDPQVRAALRERSGALCDGRGAARVAEALLQLASDG